MIRIAELKLPLAEVPFEHRRAADAPTETDHDRLPPPHPMEALTRLAAQALGVDPAAIGQLQVFKRSFDARKADLLAVYIVDVTLTDPSQEAALLQRHWADNQVRSHCAFSLGGGVDSLVGGSPSYAARSAVAAAD